MTGRKFIGTLVFALVFLIIGRNLSFLPVFQASSKNLENTKLEEKVSNYISKQKGFYSVYYKNLNSGEYFGISENKIETTASVNKVPIIATLYHLSAKGEINLDDKITIQKKDIQNYGTGSIRYEKPGGSYSIRNLAQLTLQKELPYHELLIDRFQ